MTNPDGKPVGAGYEGSVAGGVGISLLPVVGSLYDTYQSNKTARKNTELTIAANKREAELAYQRQVEMWHMQNAYNSPSEQMKRFGAAGLNPHLMYNQGNPGNASGTPAYQAPHLQYRYAAPTYGAGIASILPTLMSVGSWMQNMRQSEQQIQKNDALIDFLLEKYPREIRKADNALSVFPYQASMLESQSSRANYEWQMLAKELEHRFGRNESKDGGKSWNYIPGIRHYETLMKLAEARLKMAQSSWTDFNITNPQALMQLVLGGVMGMAGQQLRLSTQKGSIRQSPKRVKTFYQDGKRRSQVVDYD